MGATFALTESVVANQRRTDDAINGAAGGCAAGFLAGLRGEHFNIDHDSLPQILLLARSLPMAVGSCAVLGAAMGVFDYSGQLAGDQGATLEEKRRRFFKKPLKPLVETPAA